MKKRVILLVLSTLGSIIIFLPFANPTPKTSLTKTSINATAPKDTVTYQGKSGKNALSLLKEVALVQQDSSGLVIGVNGRVANSQKREYWAFYVNGKLADVGPADYVTRDSDRIEWKIKTF